MEKQIAKLLQHQNFNREFCIHGTHPKDIDNIALIQNLPLEKMAFYNVEEAILPLWLGTNSSAGLKNLAITYCRINSGTVAIIKNLIQGLTLLELCDCSMQHSELMTIIDAVGRSRVRTLKLSAESIDMNALIDCIKRSQMVDLYLSIHSFEQTQFILSDMLHLQSLSLVRMNFNGEMMVVIENCIAGPGSRLTKLVLSNSTFAGNKIIGIMRAIQQSSIHSLDLSFSFFDDNIEDIVECMKHSQVTKFISGDTEGHPDRNGTNGKNGTMTAISLAAKHHALRHVEINCSSMNDQMVSAMCNAIENSMLETFALFNCSFRDEQMVKICNSIKRSSITSLALLSGSRLNARNIALICDLIENHALAKLKLNSMTDALIELMLVSIEKSELIKFNINRDRGLSTPIKKKLKQIMLSQKLRAIAFHKTKSANMY